MKVCRRRNSMVWLSLILILSLSSMANACGTTEPVGGGSRLFDMVIENQTDRVLTIYYDKTYEVGVIEAGGSITQKVSMNRGSYPITAKNTQGEVVFSETFTFIPDDKYHLQKIEEQVYKAVIPPLQSN